MSDELAIRARGLSKRYRRIVRSQNYNSLRDALAGGVRDLLSSQKAREDRAAREAFWALDDVSFDIRRGENVGIIGLNGAGKSTLLKVLSRITTPTKGDARVNGRLGALLEVGTGFHQELSGRENVFLYGAILGMSRKEVAQKFDAIVEFSEIGDFIDTPVKRYSSGMYVRLAFAVAAHLDPDILLLDEVLAVGDFSFQRKCMNLVRSLEKSGSTILFVSHNMFSIKTMCERVIYLKKGQITYDGPTEEGLRRYESDSLLQVAHWFKSDEPAPITITDMKTCGARGDERTVFEHGEPLTLRLRYKADRRIEQPDIRISIHRSDETHCSAFSSLSDEADIPFLEGEGEIEIRTPPIKLTSELYTAYVVIRERGFGSIIAAQVGAGFHVHHPVMTPAAYGVYNERAEWTVASAKVGQEEGRTHADA